MGKTGGGPQHQQYSSLVLSRCQLSVQCTDEFSYHPGALQLGSSPSSSEEYSKNGIFLSAQNFQYGLGGKKLPKERTKKYIVYWSLNYPVLHNSQPIISQPLCHQECMIL